MTVEAVWQCKHCFICQGAFQISLVMIMGITEPDCLKEYFMMQLDCNINGLIVADHIEHLTISQSSP